MNNRIAGLLGRRRLLAWLLGFALACQLLALYLPGSTEPTTFPIPNADKVVHALLFAVPTFLAALLPGRFILISLIAVHAPISELIQLRFIPHRTGDWIDLLADGVGIGLGYLLARGVARRAARILAES